MAVTLKPHKRPEHRRWLSGRLRGRLVAGGWTHTWLGPRRPNTAVVAITRRHYHTLGHELYPGCVITPRG